MQEGDTYAKIARERLGDERYAGLIMQANGVKPTYANIHGLQLDTELVMPNLSRLSDEDLKPVLRAGGRLIANDQRITDQIAFEKARLATQPPAVNVPVDDSYNRKEINPANGHATATPTTVMAASIASHVVATTEMTYPEAMGVGIEFGGEGGGGSGVVEKYIEGAVKRTVEISKAGVNDPIGTAKGFGKSAVNLIPEFLNSIPSLVKLGMDYSPTMMAASLVAPDEVQSFRNTKPLQIPTMDINTDAEKFGSAGFIAATLVGPAAVTKIGEGYTAAKTFLESSAFVKSPYTMLYSGTPIPLLDGSVIRITTVTEEMRAAYKGAGYLDPLTNTYKAAPLNEVMAVDHILPSAKITQLEGFNTLNKEQMTNILQDRIGVGNLQPLPQSLNASKGSQMGWDNFKG